MSESEMITSVFPLQQVHPDPSQPRRLLPDDLAASLAAGALPSDILAEMRHRAKRDKWVRRKLDELDGLADSIAADGLLQPIRVCRTGEEQYTIEEGERRWWAHQILVKRGNERFNQIAAILVETPGEDRNLLRRRVAENVHRSEFTAVELAQAMSQRVAEVLASEPGTKRREVERRVGKENQMSDRRVRQYLALLTLSPQVLELAQQARLTENALRTLVGITDSSRQLGRAYQLANPTIKSPTRSGARPRTEKARNEQGNAKPKRASKRAGTATKKRSSKAKVGHPSIPHGSCTKSDQRPEIIRSLEQVISAGQVLCGKRLNQAEQDYWNQRLKDASVFQSIAKLAALLQDSISPAIQTEVAQPRNAERAE